MSRIRKLALATLVSYGFLALGLAALIFYLHH